MKKIKMAHQQKLTIEEAFNLFIASSSAKGLTEKILKTYQQHFKAVLREQIVPLISQISAKSR